MFSSEANVWAELVRFFKSWLSKINCTQFAETRRSFFPSVVSSEVNIRAELKSV